MATRIRVILHFSVLEILCRYPHLKVAEAEKILETLMLRRRNFWRLGWTLIDNAVLNLRADK